MLFYNQRQEFIGINEEGLKLLNYGSMQELMEACSDVADLFAKEPGYIHNFKSFKWIDFLLHADSDARSAIVQAKGRTFSCTLEVSNLYLREEPFKNGYIVEMVHIQPISGEEYRSQPAAAKAAEPVVAKEFFKAPEEPVAARVEPEIPEEPAFISEEPLSVPETPAYSEPSPSILPDYGHLEPMQLSEPDTFDVPPFEEGEFELPEEPLEEIYAKLGIEETEVPVSVAETPAPEEAPKPAAAVGTRFTPAEQEFIDNLKVDKSYRFDPSVAANELGLPVDLIEEFIGDFIQQSHDFKEDLFQAAWKGDMNNLKILSHKLKGVAANLRIEDAFESLSIVNTSADPVEIEANLKYFYTIIDKLEGKEAPKSVAAAQAVMNEEPVSVQSFPESEPMSTPSEEDDYLIPFEAKSYESDTAEVAQADLAEHEIYAFDLKSDDNEPMIVQEEELSRPVEAFSSIPDEINLDEEFPPAPSYTIPSEPFLTEEPDVQLQYDRVSVAGMLGIGSDFFDELIEDFKRDARGASERITSAIEAFDTAAWQKTAIGFKGISDNLRLSQISDEFSVLSSTNDAQEARKASKRLNRYLDQL